jgi:hypothetical protein
MECRRFLRFCSVIASFPHVGGGGRKIEKPQKIKEKERRK